MTNKAKTKTAELLQSIAKIRIAQPNFATVKNYIIYINLANNKQVLMLQISKFSGDNGLHCVLDVLGTDAVHVHEHSAWPTAGNACHGQPVNLDPCLLAQSTCHSFTKTTFTICVCVCGVCVWCVCACVGGQTE